MPDPVVKLWTTLEIGRTVAFDFYRLPELQAGETLLSFTGPFVDVAGPTFSGAVVSGTRVVARVGGTLIAGTSYHMWVVATTSAGNVLTCSGTLEVVAP